MVMAESINVGDVAENGISQIKKKIFILEYRKSCWIETAKLF